MKVLYAGAVSTALFSLGIVAGSLFSNSDTREPLRPTCRPSQPAKASEFAGKEVTLFLGNSIAFDTDWQVPSNRLAVNCARQGLTAKQALNQFDDLPELPVREIVIFLGSVELARSGALPVDFDDTIFEIVASLSTRYAQATIVLAGLPYHPASDLLWRYGDAAAQQARQIETIYSSQNPAIYFDTGQALAKMVSASTYDGVHLTSESYTLVNSHLLSFLSSRADQP